MFCYKCGAEISDNAEFCFKCGTKVFSEQAQRKTTSELDLESATSSDITNEEIATNNKPETTTETGSVISHNTAYKSEETLPLMHQQQSYSPPPQVQSNQGHTISKPAAKTKPKAWVLIIIGVVIAIIAILIFFVNNDNVYVASLKAHTPFNDYSYSEVLGKYLDHLEWKSFSEDQDNARLVEISGDIKNVGKHFVLHVLVIDNGDSCTFKLQSLFYDGVGTSDENEMINFLYIMFSAYDNGYTDLSSILTVSAPSESSVQMYEDEDGKLVILDEEYDINEYYYELRLSDEYISQKDMKNIAKLNIECLILLNCEVEDYSPIKSMNLNQITLSNCNVEDLSFLKNMTKLEYLFIMDIQGICTSANMEIIGNLDLYDLTLSNTGMDSSALYYLKGNSYGHLNLKNNLIDDVSAFEYIESAMEVQLDGNNLSKDEIEWVNEQLKTLEWRDKNNIWD